MLDLSVSHVAFAYRHRLPALVDVTFRVEKNTHVALVGEPGCGASTLLAIIAGELSPGGGQVRVGARDVTALPPRKRPILIANSRVDAPGRWSVRHLLVAAVRHRSLDREDRRHELELAAQRWKLESLLDRRLSTLSSTESTLAALARIELLRPGILLADRLLERASPALLPWICDEWFRVLRIMGTTVLVAPSSALELGLVDSLVVLEHGRVVQQGTPAEVFRHPVSLAAARATGEVNAIPVTVRSGEAQSAIGAWGVPNADGQQIALARPGDFSVVAHGEESDVILAVEEASFHTGAWHVRGMLTGGLELRVVLPQATQIHKGRLIPLRYDPSNFRTVTPTARDLVTEPIRPALPSRTESR